MLDNVHQELGSQRQRFQSLRLQPLTNLIIIYTQPLSSKVPPPNDTLNISLGSPVGSAHQMQKKPECIIFPCSPTLLCSRSLLNSIIPGFDIIKFIILSLYTQPSLLFYSASGVSLRYVSFSLSSRCLGESLNRLSPAQVVWLLNCVSASRVLHDS